MVARMTREEMESRSIKRLNLRVTAGASGKWYLRANASDIHSHKTNKHIWANYAEIRVVTDPHLTKDVGVLHKASANAQRFLHYP
ncbi:hypothetical protein PHMEG_00031778 [Phytophthora megakarya]|uniref:Uncharacterized protein n=1 Tax=Phytophthora megakarya TaxID=4795 RepID=A0A225UXB1_9STRA|nr:hypothetical protein PHMEG_00031778 [Phytophthora megakarya]